MSEKQVEYYQCICGRHTRAIVGTKRLALGLCDPCFQEVKSNAKPMIDMGVIDIE
jgi:hypothetical protein